MSTHIQNTLFKLIPFFITLVLYFVVFIPHEEPQFIAALLKCLPIVSLIIFMLWYSSELEQKNTSFSRRITYGLIFSCLGDFCLIWPQTFELGMLAFACCHVHYIKAFGFIPLCLKEGIYIYGFCLIGLIWIVPSLHGVCLLGVPIYSIIISTMFWRSLCKLKHKFSGWKMCSFLGATLFVLSDIIIAIDKFKFKVYNDQILIMATYYAAQFGIALSVLDLKPIA